MTYQEIAKEFLTIAKANTNTSPRHYRYKTLKKDEEILGYEHSWSSEHEHIFKGWAVNTSFEVTEVDIPHSYSNNGQSDNIEPSLIVDLLPDDCVVLIIDELDKNYGNEKNEVTLYDTGKLNELRAELEKEQVGRFVDFFFSKEVAND